MNKVLSQNLLVFTKRFFLIFLFYQLCRIGFYFYNAHLLDPWNSKILMGGIRFDLAALGFINMPFALLHLIPGNFQNNKAYQKVLFYSFFIVNIFILCLNFVDYEYFKFIGRRSSYSFITASGMEQELPGLLKNFIVEFWWIPLFIFLTFLSFWYIYRKIKYQVHYSSFNVIGLITALVVTGIMLVLGRGGLQEKPIRLVDASQYGGLKNTALVLNTPFSVLKTMGKSENLEDINFYSNEELNKIFNPIQEFKYDSINKKNVVLLIVESFGRETMHRGLTPFMDSLALNSHFFENGFANGKVSIDAVPSSISSIPSLMNRTFITSSYALNDVYALPKILNEQGYYTAFFHGAFNGSQNFDQYANVAGFKDYFGKNEYEGPEAFDGSWGIFDEEFLQFFAKKLDGIKQPFFTTLFTISSHNPYTIPEKYKGKFPKGEANIHESIAYADYSLKQFFETAKTKDWYNNTIFIITADHTSSEPQEDIWKSNVGMFRIPILFFAPGDETIPVEKVEKSFQQIDILPSLMDYLQINTKIVSYGKSFRSDKDFVVNYLNNIYNYEKGDYYLAFDGKKSLGLYNWKLDPTLKNNLIDQEPEKLVEMETFIKAYIQSFNYRVKNNMLIIK
ncbi:LTA synthase family protein [Myroides phaeus]|uniref:Phosphoglycerol transferase MdoB n=1 Tax=Myroides phaeus TaxID=702745 RepID=A0A1G8GGY5_9FLAO|nr:alkaline phosphatase family protein [Myroides phaeus]SDH93648.1 Phosphoglycerol transferase MdoB [Myroides phaeus]